MDLRTPGMLGQNGFAIGHDLVEPTGIECRYSGGKMGQSLSLTRRARCSSRRLQQP